MENAIFTLATTADAQLVVDYRIAFATEFAGKQPPMIEKETRTRLHTYFSKELNKNYICWYAKDGDEIAAIGGLVLREGPGNLKNPSGKWGYIMNVYTVPHHRRKGYCSAILDRLIGTARERGVMAIELHASKAGAPVYEKHGFELHPEPTYRKYFWDETGNR
jgi:GNAT superfamily N-acetyltransferase